LSNVAVDQRPAAAAITAAVAARTAILRIVSPSAAWERRDCTRISPAAPIVRRFTQADFFVVPVSCRERRRHGAGETCHPSGGALCSDSRTPATDLTEAWQGDMPCRDPTAWLCAQSYPNRSRPACPLFFPVICIFSGIKTYSWAVRRLHTSGFSAYFAITSDAKKDLAAPSNQRIYSSLTG
jgi:hypothetical protein